MNDRDELEEELKIYKTRLEAAMGAGNLAWWEMELPSGKVRFNDRKAEMLGYSSEKFDNYTDFTDLLHPEDHDRAMEAMEDHLEGKKERYEVEYRIKKKDGGYVWFRDVGKITEEKDDYKKVTGIVIDIDDRKKAEGREDLLHSLLRHDVRNKLQVIRGYIDLLDDFDFSEEAEKYLSLSKGSVREAVEIIEKVRTLREAQEEKVYAVDAKRVIFDVVDRFEELAEEKDIDVDVEFMGTDHEVKAGSLLDRVFSNIIENAFQHSDGSEIRIRSKTDGDEVRYIIEDDGKGIPDEKKDKIFNKGYTTDEKRGSGLGMFLVRTLIEAYGGQVEVEDSELGGVKFVVRLKKA